jgi:hypothetical protein
MVSIWKVVFHLKNKDIVEIFTEGGSDFYARCMYETSFPNGVITGKTPAGFISIPVREISYIEKVAVSGDLER